GGRRPDPRRVLPAFRVKGPTGRRSLRRSNGPGRGAWPGQDWTRRNLDGVPLQGSPRQSVRGLRAGWAWKRARAGRRGYAGCRNRWISQVGGYFRPTLSTDEPRNRKGAGVGRGIGGGWGGYNFADRDGSETVCNNSATDQETLGPYAVKTIEQLQTERQ